MTKKIKNDPELFLQPNHGNLICLDEIHQFLNPSEMWVIAQVDSTYPGPEGVKVTNLRLFLEQGPL
jgi:hypothetical protein